MEPEKLTKNQITWVLLDNPIFPFEQEYKLVQLHIRDKFITNLKAQHRFEYYKKISKSMSWYNFISTAFDWQATPEGHNFWKQISEAYD